MCPRKAALFLSHPETRRVLLAQFQHWGWNVSMARLRDDESRWLREHQPDLLVVEQSARAASGEPVWRSLKLQQDTNPLPLVLVLDPGQADLPLQGLEVAPEACVSQPLHPLTLRQALQQALQEQTRRTQQRLLWESQFRLHSSLEFLEQLVAWTDGMWFLQELPSSDKMQLQLALREMGMNAIEWGHRRQRDRIITIIYRVDDQKIEILIRDCGPGFNPLQLPHAADRDDPLRHIAIREARGLREGGFGILMARGLVDALTYNATGNEVRLIKYWPSAKMQREDASSLCVRLAEEAANAPCSTGTKPDRPQGQTSSDCKGANRC